MILITVYFIFINYHHYISVWNKSKFSFLLLYFFCLLVILLLLLFSEYIYQFLYTSLTCVHLFFVFAILSSPSRSNTQKLIHHYYNLYFFSIKRKNFFLDYKSSFFFLTQISIWTKVRKMINLSICFQFEKLTIE